MSNMATDSIDPDEDAQQQVDRSPLAPTLGAQLAAQRQALNWSVEQIANQLNLAPRQIQAIEADNFAALPGIAIARGFIRSYAKLLKMDPAPLLLNVTDETRVASAVVPARRALPSASFSERRLMGSRRRFPLKSIIFGLLFIGVVLTLFIAQQKKWISVLPESMSLKLDSGLAVLSGTVQQRAPAVGGDTESSVISNSVSSGDGVAPIQPVEATIATPAEAPIRTVNLTGVATTGLAADTKNMLVLKLREDSWLEIKRPDGSTLIARLVKAGAIEKFNITEPVSVTVGNASGVEAILRGSPLALSSGAKSNVARLTLK